MKPTRTPGPWFPGKDGQSIIATPGPDCKLDADTLEAYGGDVVCESVSKADQPLICAAPDLLAAARDVCQLFGTDDPQGRAEMRDAVRDLRAAITKARGQQP